MAVVAVVIASAVATARMAVRARSATVTPAPSRLPAFPPLPEDFGGVVLASYLALGSPASLAEALVDDPLLRSPVLRDPDFTRDVHDWVDYWARSARRWFPGFLERMASMGPHVDSALSAAGLPPSLRYLPLIESGYDPRVTSRASAVGLWQLMPETAGDLDLEVTSIVDERRHPERSTTAALRYIRILHAEFDSWLMVLAAYNSGPERVRGILRAHAPAATPSDSLFWALREHFPRETREFVPKLFGAMWVASDPESYGYSSAEVDPVRTDIVYVHDRTTLDVVALAAGVPYGDVLRLNPEFLRGVTPTDRRVQIRIPEGRARTFRRIYPRIRPQDRVRFVEHEVSVGETMATIAARYGVGVEELTGENPRLQTRVLEVGVRVVVPVAPPVEAVELPG